jgi:2-aminoethylphosphonate-pyruvate transaminase
MTSDAVRFAAAQPDLNHRDPAFTEMLREVKESVVRVYPAANDVEDPGFQPYLIGGSGTAAVEAMVTSCVASGPVLIIENGYYSGRLKEKFEIHHIPHETLSFDWLEAWDMARIEEKMSDGRFEAVICAHHETTTGRLNPVEELAELCWTYNCRLLVDAMSSYGADDLDLFGIDALASSANKCLHGLPGISFVLVKNDLAKAMARWPRRTYYLSLPMYGGDSPPLTPPVPILSAFRQALREIGRGGQAQRRLTYSAHSKRLRRALEELGFSFAVPEEEASCTLVCASLPPGWNSVDWLAANRQRGYAVYGCKGPVQERFFQASVMGEVTDEHLEGWLAVVKDLLSRA